ncbi:MAG: hypothetical protein ACI8W3_003460, partial [Myxococcota bacterium]
LDRAPYELHPDAHVESIGVSAQMNHNERALGNLRSWPMLLLFFVADVIKRMGFGKQMVRIAMGRMFTEKIKASAFSGYTPTEHDVIVATFAKSGTNWMLQIAQQIACRGEAEFDHIHDVAPWPDAPRPGPIALDDLGPQQTSPTGLRVIKTHLATNHVPYCEKAKYLTVIRDPKEVLVSSYYFLGGIMGVLEHVTIDDWYDLFMREGGLGESWAEHTAGYWEWRDKENVLVLNYGSIKEEPVASIERVAATMGVALSADELAQVVERASFQYMQARESQFAPPPMPFSKSDQPVLMVRRGATGDSGELLSPQQQASVDRLCMDALNKLGSDFPYTLSFTLATGKTG